MLKASCDFPQTWTELFSLCTHSPMCLFLHSSIKLLCLRACYRPGSCATLWHSTTSVSCWLTKRKAVPGIQEFAWYLWLDLGVLLLNIQHLIKHQHQTRPLCDHGGLRKTNKKQDCCATMFEHRQNMDIVQFTNITKLFFILSDMSDCGFFSNYSFSLALVFPFPR